MPKGSTAELHTNTRAQWLLVAPWLGLEVLGMMLVILGLRSSQYGLAVIGGVSCVLVAVGLIRSAIELWKPRLRIRLRVVR